MAKLSITWKISTIGYAKNQRKTIEALGLRKLNHTVIHNDTPAIRGMVKKIEHLLEVSETE